MNFYKLIKLNHYIKNPQLKFLGLLILHITKKRYLALHFDPVNACNLRCKMCYFTDKNYVKNLKGIFPSEDIAYFGNAFFNRALKLQIGCGTEPTLYKNIDEIVKTATKYKVPQISLITNGILLEKEKTEKWVANGLSEIVLSLHGVKKDTYENLMEKGNYEVFLNALQIIKEIKNKYPLKLRINYTFNEDNFEELNDFYKTFGKYNLDFLQIRPIRKMGNTTYNNFSLGKIIPIYNRLRKELIEASKEHNVTLIMHNMVQIENRISIDSVITKYVYCYISPTYLFNEDFKWKRETYDIYAKRISLKKELLKDVFSSKKRLLKYIDDRLNYTIN